MEPDLPLEQAKVKLSESVSVDLCIMLDCTGSMGSYIEMSKNKIKDIIDEVKKAYPDSEIRLSIVGYRDFCDSKRFEILPFTPKIETAKTFLTKLRADGGGDTPEDVNGAFQKALFDLKWESSVRLLTHVADAPCHGKEFHSCDDSFPKGNKEDMSWNKIFHKLIELQIDYLFLKISGITDTMFKKFKEIAQNQGLDEKLLNFQQESVQPEAGSKKKTSEKKGGGDIKMSHEEHYAAKIVEKVKDSVDKELKHKFARRLENRTTDNAKLVENIKKNVAEAVKIIDFNSLKEKYGDLSAKIGECILSSNNFIEALADEDCLCLTFNIGRSQAAIVDPTQVVIKGVYPSFLTAGSFFHSTEFALKKNKLAHGG